MTGKLEETLLGSTFALCGLRYPDQQIVELFQTMSLTLEDSTTYQWILRKGAVQEACATILRQGTKRFGPPPPATDAAVRAMTDHPRLQRMADRIIDATNWDEVLATP